jgi:hypothetical protein
MTPEDFERIGNQALVSLAAGHDCMWQGDLLEPHLWEALRLELQRRYRRSTGETMAVLTIEASPPPSNQTTDLQNDPATLRSYCQQLLDLIENYGVEVEGEDNDLVAHISRSVDPAHIEAEGRNDG